MPAKKNKNYTTEFKAKVALDAIKADLTINEISSKYSIHSTQINRWKQLALASLKTCFNGKHEKATCDTQQQMDKLYQQIGQLTCENDFLKKSVWS
jgi:transposase